MSTSLLIAILAVAVCSVAAFFAGRWTSTAYIAQRRYSRDVGKPPLWLKNYKDNGYTRTVFQKVSRYFDKEKPYLDSDLSLDDVARVVGTNRSYVARSVKVYTGRNFCQFVNHYRIKYMMDLFKADPSLRVNELSARSGFNSPTSFSIAFKLEQDMPPGEWCRRVRAGIIKS